MSEMNRIPSDVLTKEDREKLKIEMLTLLENCSKEDIEIALSKLKKQNVV